MQSFRFHAALQDVMVLFYAVVLFMCDFTLLKFLF